MRRTTWGLSCGSALVAVLLLFVAAPASAQDDGEATFTGAWDTTYGLLELVQDGSTVEGSYTYGGGSTVEGTIEDGRLTFRYTEPTTAGEGWFELSADGQAIDGMWREDGTSSWYPWNGTRSSSRGFLPTTDAGGVFSGLYDTTYGRLRLVHNPDDDTVIGSYSYSGGSSVEGTVEGNRLTFRYTEPDAAGEGWWEISEDGDTLTGQWTADGSGAWAEWTGTRVEPEAGVVWLVILEAHWEYTIAEEEYSFGEMLDAYFARFPNVEVRQRRVNDREDFLRAGAEVSYLAEPVALLLASHGAPGELHMNGESVGGTEITEVLQNAPNVFLVHFSSCSVMVGNTAESILDSIADDRPLALSGYQLDVDWSASAILEYLYLDLVLGRGLSPSHAAGVLESELGFFGPTATPGSPLGATSFRLIEN